MLQHKSTIMGTFMKTLFALLLSFYFCFTSNEW